MLIKSSSELIVSFPDIKVHIKEFIHKIRESTKLFLFNMGEHFFGFSKRGAFYMVCSSCQGI